VHEHVFAAIVTNDEAEALLPVEEFYDTLAFADDLGRHTATTAAATAETTAAAAEAAAATAAEAAATAAITAAETSTIAAEAATAAAEAAAITAKAATTAAEAATVARIVEIVVAETVALILAAPAAATSIKTHALLVTFASPQDQIGQTHVGRMTCRIHRRRGFGNHYINFSAARE
jgi:hypothetical protein